MQKKESVAQLKSSFVKKQPKTPKNIDYKTLTPVVNALKKNER